MSEDNDQLIVIWRRIIVGDGKSWVLFKHGTCVILKEPVADLPSAASTLMKEWGSVRVGTPSADFDVVGLQDDPGWVVTCHHPDILTYVGQDEFEGESVPSDVVIGLIGRSKRGQDAEELEISHVEA